jgi:hypothetical protein
VGRRHCRQASAQRFQPDGFDIGQFDEMPVRKRRVGPAIEAGELALQMPLKVGVLIFKQVDVIAESKLPRIGRPLGPGKGAVEGCRSKSMLGGN